MTAPGTSPRPPNGQHYQPLSIVADMALAIAAAGIPVFPCGADKRPLTERGFKDASTDPASIRTWFLNPDAKLIGIPTGKRSNISVLDIDQKHPEAVVWWQDSHPLLLPTRAFKTRSGGLHLYFRHREGVTDSQGKICHGIDTRGEGGYVISWFAYGLDCLDHATPAPWPAWLLDELTRQPAPYPAPKARTPDHANRAIDGIVRRLESAREGERNAVLFWAACRCVERGMRQGEIEGLLLPAAIGAGLHDIEARRTVASAQRRPVA